MVITIIIIIIILYYLESLPTGDMGVQIRPLREGVESSPGQTPP